MESITINFTNPEDITVVQKVIEALGFDVSYEENITDLISDELLKKADKNYNNIQSGTRKTKPWAEVKAKVLSKNG